MLVTLAWAAAGAAVTCEQGDRGVRSTD